MRLDHAALLWPTGHWPASQARRARREAESLELERLVSAKSKRRRGQSGKLDKIESLVSPLALYPCEDAVIDAPAGLSDSPASELATEGALGATRRTKSAA